MEALAVKKKRVSKSGTSLKVEKLSIKDYFALVEENETEFNLEFNNGILEEKTKMMTIKQTYIYHNLADYLVNAKYFEKGYRIFAEKEFRTDANKVRIPDMVLLDERNVKDTIKGLNVVPNLLIEVISENDSFMNFEYKLIEYFNAGVKCVWAIIPDIELVYVYSSPREVVIYAENQFCTAKPTVDFEIITNKIFRK